MTRPVGVEELASGAVQTLIGVRTEIVALRLQKICRKPFGGLAFEVRKQSTDGTMGEVVYFSNFLKFSVPRNIPLIRTGIYAVQADGERILVNKE